MSSLASVLKLLNLNAEILSSSGIQWIETVAERLPPALTGGFELREASEEADFQLAWQLAECRQLEEAAASIGYRPLEVFARNWDPVVQEVWLEFDFGADFSKPCIFWGLDINRGSPRELQESIRGILRLLDRSNQFESLSPIFTACRGEQTVSHFGLMLSRPERGLRVNVKRITPSECSEFLVRAGFKPAVVSVPENCEFDRFVLALDLPGGYAGLECGCRHPELVIPWSRLFSPRLARAMANWPEIIHPGNSGLWPSFLIVPSLLSEVDRFGILEKRIDHIKVCPRGQLKVYPGFRFNQIQGSRS